MSKTCRLSPGAPAAIHSPQEGVTSKCPIWVSPLLSRSVRKKTNVWRAALNSGMSYFQGPHLPRFMPTTKKHPHFRLNIISMQLCLEFNLTKWLLYFVNLISHVLTSILGSFEYFGANSCLHNLKSFNFARLVGLRHHACHVQGVKGCWLKSTSSTKCQNSAGTRWGLKGPRRALGKWQEDEPQDKRVQLSEKARCLVRESREAGMPWTMRACQVTAGNAASQAEQAREWNGPAKVTSPRCRRKYWVATKAGMQMKKAQRPETRRAPWRRSATEEHLGEGPRARRLVTSKTKSTHVDTGQVQVVEFTKRDVCKKCLSTSLHWAPNMGKIQWVLLTWSLKVGRDNANVQGQRQWKLRERQADWEGKSERPAAVHRRQRGKSR